MVTLVAVVSVTMGVPGGFGKAKKREIRELSFLSSYLILLMSQV